MLPSWNELVRSQYNNRQWEVRLLINLFFFQFFLYLIFYRKLFKVDLYVGLLMEEPVSGGELGPTSLCIIAHQAW